MLIKIDTREQLPYSFIIPSEVGTLPIGDYSISGLEHNISIERKTLDDLVGCLTQQRERFERELFRGKALDYFTLVVEGSLSDIQMRKYFSKTPSEGCDSIPSCLQCPLSVACVLLRKSEIRGTGHRELALQVC